MSGADRQFVDTNVLIYAHDLTAGGKRDMAAQLIRDLWRGRCGCLSVQVLQEFYVVATRKVGLPTQQARRIIEHLGWWRVHSPTAGDVLSAVDLLQEGGISFWDAMVVCSAQRTGCRVLWSEDLQDGRRFGHLVVHNPFAPIT
jgi:predicted nucleic acid-binding protein